MAATVNQFYAPAAMVGDSSLANSTIIIDPPLTLERDSSGHLHLGISLQSGIMAGAGIMETSAPGGPLIIAVDPLG